jgi:protein-tyrosine phosphatase
MKRHVEFTHVHNFRDLGGYGTGDSRKVEWGRLYRSDSLSKLAGEDWELFAALGVRTVIDLRYPYEIEASGRIPGRDGLAYYNFSIEHRPYDQAGLDPGIEPGRFLADRFAEVATDGVKELRQALEVLAGEHSAPVVFHCASGKDRTGLLAALVLGLLGVHEQDIITDFTLTGLATRRLIADYTAGGRNPPPRWPWYGHAPAEVMRLFLADLAAAYGSIRGYAESRLGIDDTLIEALQRRYLTT